MPTVLRVAARAGALSEAQTTTVARRLEELHRDAGLRTELILISTRGDRDRRTALKSFGAVGVFVKELEQALLDGRADCAVHSLKDVPLDLPAGLTAAAIPEREDARDALVSRDGATLTTLPKGATVGTGSPRRRAQAATLRLDLRFAEIRGNIGTRLRRVAEGKYDAVFLAAAGLKRTGLLDRAAEIIPYKKMLPAPGQGALLIECRADDARTREVVKAVHDRRAAVRVAAERAALRTLGGGCGIPLGAYAEYTGDGAVKLRTALGNQTGSQLLRTTATAAAGAPPANDAEEAAAVEAAAALGRRAAQDLLAQGGDAFL